MLDIQTPTETYLPSGLYVPKKNKTRDELRREFYIDEYGLSPDETDKVLTALEIDIANFQYKRIDQFDLKTITEQELNLLELLDLANQYTHSKLLFDKAEMRMDDYCS